VNDPTDPTIDLGAAGLGPSPLGDVPTGELLHHVGRPGGPLTVGDRRSDHHVARSMIVLMVLVLALIVFTAVVQLEVLRSLDHICGGA
jgi:hypothetical protein